MSLAEKVTSVTFEAPVADELADYGMFTVRSVLAEDVQAFGVGLPAVWPTFTEVAADTEISGDLPDLDSEPWHATAGLEDMELVVARVRHVARDVCPVVEFGSPLAETVHDENGDVSMFVVLRIFIPNVVDDFTFRDDFFPRIAELLRPEDIARLAVYVISL